MATHSSILVWEIAWIKEPGGLQSMGSQKVGHNWAINTYICVLYVYLEFSTVTGLGLGRISLCVLRNSQMISGDEFFFRWTFFIMILISILSWFICSQQPYGFGTIIKSNTFCLPVFNLCYRVRSFIRFDGKDTQQMMIPGSLRFTLRTVRKFFLNLGRKLQITKLNQWRKISRYYILSHSGFF